MQFNLAKPNMGTQKGGGKVKRGLIFCLLIAVIFTMVMIPVNAAEEWAKIEIQTPSELPKAGEEFEVVAYIEGVGLAGFQIDLFAENESVECIEIVLGEMVDSVFSAQAPETNYGAARIGGLFAEEEFSGEGTLATYKFLAKENIDSLEFEFSNVEFIDAEENYLPYTITGATERIPEEPSDAEVKDEEIEHLYADTEGHWSEHYINTATEKGLFKGDENGFFNPDENVTRAQFVTVLWRLAGSPAADAEKVVFADIDGQSREFKTAIAWGYNNGYINGTSATTFKPEENLTREAAVKILHAYSGGQSGMELLFAQIYDAYFKDSNRISSWAKPSVYWGIYYELISGTSADTISPQETATRAQLAKILVNYITTYTN